MFQVLDETEVKCHANKGARAIKVYQTAEGLLLSVDPYWTSINIKPSRDIKAANELLLSDKDFIDRNLLKLYQGITTRFCTTFVTLLKAISKLEDEYMVIEDFRGNEAVVYASHGVVYIPKCQMVEEIEIITNTTNCFEDIPIRFTINNRTFPGFITTEGIVKLTSKLISCDIPIEQIIMLKNGEQVIKRKNNQVELINKKSIILQRLDLVDNNISTINFQHFKGILDTVDILKQVEEMTMIKEAEQNFYVAATGDSESSSQWLDNLNSWFKRAKDKLILAAIIMIAIIVIILICCMCTCGNCWLLRLMCRPCKKQRKTRRYTNIANKLQTADEIELNPVTKAIMMKNLTNSKK